MAGALVVAGWSGALQAQTEERRYQIEVSIFAHESGNLAQEHWPQERLSTAFAENGRVLGSRMDVLDLPDWNWVTEPVRFEEPVPQRQGDFRLPDVARDAFVALPVAEHNFTDTNRALTASPNYRLLFHGAWRQPLQVLSQAQPLLVAAGREFGERHELEGSLLVGFNPGRDRVILSTDLWLTQFGSQPVDGLSLPPLPDALRPEDVLLPDEELELNAALLSGRGVSSESINRMQASAPGGRAGMNGSAALPVYYPARVTPVRSERAMRSREFHYLDHPAAGIVVQVFPYEPPSAPADVGSMPFISVDPDALSL